MPKRELSKEFKDRIGHPPTHTSKNIVKKEERIAKAREKGRIEGEYAAHDKKSFMLEIKEHFGHVIDNTKMNDWVEIIAAVGITPIIHDAISVSENVLNILGKVVGLDVAIAKSEIISGPFGIYTTIMNWVQQNSPSQTASQTQPPAITSELLSWLLSFSVAYMIIHFGDKLLNSGNITAGLSSIMGLLGVTSL